jgi:hypothetical protein
MRATFRSYRSFLYPPAERRRHRAIHHAEFKTVKPHCRIQKQDSSFFYSGYFKTLLNGMRIVIATDSAYHYFSKPNLIVWLADTRNPYFLSS